MFDLGYVNNLGEEIKNSLVGGEGINGSLSLLRNVYGINKDFSVWYIDENGKMYGAKKIVEMPIDPLEIVKASDGLKQGIGIEGDLTVGDVRGKTKLSIDGSKMIEQIKDLDELTYFPNLSEITLKNLNLNNISGLQYLPNLKSIWFDNMIVKDYSGLEFALNVTGFYLINGSVTEENIENLTSQFAKMASLETVRIRNNDSLTKIPKLKSLGKIKTLWIEENKNLTNIYGLSTVDNKSDLLELGLQDNNLTDVVETTDKHDEYDYILPKITDSSVINMSFIDGYRNLEAILCGPRDNTFYENGVRDATSNNQINLHYLSGLKNGQLVGINNLKKLSRVNFEYSDIFDVEVLELFENENSKNQILKNVLLLGNLNLKNSQINLIAGLLENCRSYSLSGCYLGLLNSNKGFLDYNNSGLENLSFLDGNKKTTSLLLKSCNFDDSQTQYIGKMTQLTRLDLSNCKNINDFSFLRKLSNLTDLSVSKTNVRNEDISSLTCKNTLKRLNVYTCPNLSEINNLDEFPLLGSEEDYFDFRWWSWDYTKDLSYFNRRNYRSLIINSGNLTTIQDAISRLKSDYGLHISGDKTLLKQLESCTNISFLMMSSMGDKSDENSFSRIK